MCKCHYLSLKLAYLEHFCLTSKQLLAQKDLCALCLLTPTIPEGTEAVVPSIPFLPVNAFWSSLYAASQQDVAFPAHANGLVLMGLLLLYGYQQSILHPALAKALHHEGALPLPSNACTLTSDLQLHTCLAVCFIGVQASTQRSVCHQSALHKCHRAKCPWSLAAFVLSDSCFVKSSSLSA